MPTVAKKAKKHVVDLAALAQDMELCRLALRKPRSERTEMVRQFVGSHWSEEGAQLRVPVNLLSLYVGIVGRALIAKEPRGMFGTFDQSQKAVVAAEQDWCNKQVQKMRLAKTLQRVVTDALFSIGICKVALASPSVAAQQAWNLQAGEPFAERIDLDDFVFDIHARDFGEVSYIGHRYRVPLDTIRDDPMYSSQRKDLEASNDEPFNQQGDERISVLGRTYYATSTKEFEPHVDLWEIYLPRKRLILTLAHDFDVDPDKGPLLQREWLGPDCGPYHILGLQTVPGNAMPKGPLQDLYDLHLFVNQTYRKLMRQAERQKTNTFVQGGASEDGGRIMLASDGDILKVDSPDKIKQVVTNEGPNNSNFIFVQKMWEMFSKMGGNLEMIGGIAPQSKTATQDKMLMEQAGAQVASMQQDTTIFTEGVFRALCWYFHHHPSLEMKTKYQLPGLPELAITRKVTPQQRRQVKYDDLDIEIDVYSMQGQTPQSKLQSITQVLQTLQPLMPLAAQQGVMPDINRLVAIFSKFLDCPELMEILQVVEPPQQEGKTPEQPGMAQETTRNYVRRSLGGDGEQEQSAELANTLAKGMGQNNSMPLNPNGAA